MGILLAHELGHYVVARAHGFALSLPMFLPAPIWVGTVGAIIRLEDRPRSRNGLLEMGVAGPLFGLVGVVAVGIGRLLLQGNVASDSDWILSTPALLWFLGVMITGSAPTIQTSDPLLFAAWIGCLVTAMNLLPFGQLDGGHVIGAIWPQRARLVGWVATAALVLMGLWWAGWWAWVVALHLLGARIPVQARNPGVPLSVRARVLAGVGLLSFILTFTLIPTS
jgi:membrane-associated protease RseP (regulator of RpoE activity)